MILKTIGLVVILIGLGLGLYIRNKSIATVNQQKMNPDIPDVPESKVKAYNIWGWILMVIGVVILILGI